MKPKYNLIERFPTEDEYVALSKAVGVFRYIAAQSIAPALQNSLFGVVAESKGEVIGTGRVIGDGAIFFYIQDMMVLPKYQKMGIGTAIMDALVAYVHKTAPGKCYVSLFTHEETAPFYARYGFKGPEDFLYGMCVKKFSKPLQRKTEKKSPRCKNA